MDMEALRTRILEDIETGDKPFLVIANAGTVSTGAVDPLSRLASLLSRIRFVASCRRRLRCPCCHHFRLARYPPHVSACNRVCLPRLTAKLSSPVNCAADSLPVIVKTTVERARIHCLSPHNLVWCAVSANDLHAQVETQIDDFLQGYQPQVQHSDWDGKLRCYCLKFGQRLRNKYNIRNRPDLGGQVLGTSGIVLQDYDGIRHLTTFLSPQTKERFTPNTLSFTRRTSCRWMCPQLRERSI